MPWFKVDDAFSVHPKAIKAGNKAIGLWTRAGSWCAQQLTDGHVPAYVVPMLGGDDEDAEALIGVRLWVAVDGGYQFRDWSDYQPSKESVQAEREAARERQRRAREAAKVKRHGVTSPVTNGVTVGVTNAEVQAQSRSPHPIPSHPDQNTAARAAATAAFDEFWAVYPKKAAKGQAVKAYRAAVKKVDAATILAALRAQLPWFASQEKPDGDFRPNASSWLNGERWADELSPRPTVVPGDQWSRALVVGRDV